MTNEELQKLKDLLLPELKTALLAEAQGVGDNDVRPVSSLKDIKSLLAYLKVGLDVEIVEAPLSLLQVEIQTTEANVQWRLGEGDWENIIAISDLQKPATDAAKRADEKMVQISKDVNQTREKLIEDAGKINTDLTASVNELKEGLSTSTAHVILATNAAKEGAIAATGIAMSVSDNPGYIGEDYHVYKWDYTVNDYVKTDRVLRPEGFSIYRQYTSIALMDADKANVPEGKFVLINTGNVEQGDNAQLYVKGATNFEFLVDMSGAIGFTGKTPQITIGAVTVGTLASASLSPDGTDTNGNPKFKLNLVIVAGPQGLMPVIEMGTVTTGLPGTDVSATLVPNGQTTDGRDKYLLDLAIPQGTPGTGSGNVSVSGSGLVTSKKYLFVPSTNDSTTGTFIEYIAPTIPEQVQPDWNASSGKGSILNKPTIPAAYTHPALTARTSGLYKITVNAEGHVTDVVAVAKTDITTLGIPAQDTIYNDNAIRTQLSDIEAIARGKSRAKVFDTVAALDTWIAVTANKATLQIGDNFYIKAINVPDYWWDGVAKQPIEGEKVDLTDYVKKETGKGLFSGLYNDLSGKPTIPTIPGVATAAANGLMSKDDKVRLDFFAGRNDITTLVSLPVTKRTINATLSAATSLSLNGSLPEGFELLIRCIPSAAFTQPIPNTGAWISMSGVSFATTANKPFEISIWCYKAGYYSVVVKDQD